MRELVVDLGIDAVVGLTRDLDHLDGILFTLDPDQSDVALDVVAANRLDHGLPIHQQMTFELASEFFEARGEVDGIADHRVIEAIDAAEVSRDGLAGGDADSDIYIL